MPALSPEAWATLRAEWEFGLDSTRALAARHGVSEKAVRKRAADRHDPWQRNPEAAARARERGREAALRALSTGRSAAEVRVDTSLLVVNREVVAAALADAAAEANLRQLASAEELRNLFGILHSLCVDMLEGDAAVAAVARDRFPEHRGVAGAILALGNLALAAQAIERKALGFDEPRRNARKGAGAQSMAGPAVDASALPAEHLKALAEFAAVHLAASSV